MQTGNLVVAVTGASGAIYAQRFLLQAVARYDRVYLMLSEQAIDVAQTELGVTLSRTKFDSTSWLGRKFDNLELLDSRNFFTPPASGSFRHDGMVIVPCSMGTIGRIAHGISNDLITRSADVCMKERRKLIVVPRETPVNAIMLRNMASLAELGCDIVPASPGWYHRPKTLEDLADTVVARILQLLGQPHNLTPQWMVDE